MTALSIMGEDFTRFFMLYLDASGRFLDPEHESDGEPRVVEPAELPIFLKNSIELPEGVTDVFVWVHGWQNDELRSLATAKRLFANLAYWFDKEQSRYPRLKSVKPAFVAVHWPSTSLPTRSGYVKIRNRAKAMTTQGQAEFFLASLLGYLEERNHRVPEQRKVLLAKAGFYVHCLGHSFGGRFLAAAIQTAATPSTQTRKVLAAVHRETPFAFNVDSFCVLQMAAGRSSFQTDFATLLKGPICGPIVLTNSIHDTALCDWHAVSEFELGIGCRGALEPRDQIKSIAMRTVEQPYADDDFCKDITNVDASDYYARGGWIEGAHSDYWQTETMHLIASVVEQVRR